MSAQPIETDLDAGFVTNTSDYEQIRGIEKGTRLADDDESSSPSDAGVFRPRTRPILVREEPSLGLVEIIKQKWSGTVIAFDNDEIQVRLEDLTNPSGPDEFVVLGEEEIDPQEQALIQKGAMFLWHIGYRQGPKYPKERFSKIRFRRLPGWTEAELLEAEKTAKEYANFFLDNKNSSS